MIKILALKLRKKWLTLFPPSKRLKVTRKEGRKRKKTQIKLVLAVYFRNNFLDGLEWTEYEDKLLFTLYKQYGPKWVTLAPFFTGRSVKNLKNRFYSTLRRIARIKANAHKDSELACLIKEYKAEYVEEALKHGHTCFSKRGRPKKTSRNEYAIPQEKKVSVVRPSGTQKVKKNNIDTSASVKSEESQEAVIDNNFHSTATFNNNHVIIDLNVKSK
jgi:hypothetical protein